jgi:FixJ family two-component response regulator
MTLGARFYIKKPYDPEELLDAIKRALEKDSDTS